jgi:hypothetical protein
MPPRLHPKLELVHIGELDRLLLHHRREQVVEVPGHPVGGPRPGPAGPDELAEQLLERGLTVGRGIGLGQHPHPGRRAVLLNVQQLRVRQQLGDTVSKVGRNCLCPDDHRAQRSSHGGPQRLDLSQIALDAAQRAAGGQAPRLDPAWSTTRPGGLCHGAQSDQKPVPWKKASSPDFSGGTLSIR